MIDRASPMIRAIDGVTARRIGRTLSANAYGQLVTVLVQVALVPLLLHAWGTRLYGTWLLLSAVPFYLTFSDFGLTWVAKNEMVMAVAAGRRDEALRVFQSIFALLCVAVPILLAGSGVLVIGLHAVPLLAIEDAAPAAASTTLLLLIGNVLLYQFFLLVCAGIRAENRPASEATWAASARLAEGTAVAFAALAGGGIVAAAAAMVAARLLFLIGGYSWLRARAAWLRLGIGEARWATLTRLMPPALAYMVLPLGQAVLIQGPVLVVGGKLGAVAVVIFSTSRTLARLGTTAANMIGNSLTSEYAALAGAKDRIAAARLFRIQATVSSLLAALYVLAVLAVAPFILPWLTHDAVKVVQPFFALLVGSVAAEMLWSALFTPMAAVNRHRRVTLCFGMVAVGAIATCQLLVARFGLSGVAAVLLAAHAAMIPVCIAGRRSHAG